MTELTLQARITADGTAFAGQMRAAKAGVDEVKAAFAGAGGSAQQFSRAANESANAQRGATIAAEALAQAQTRVGAASVAASRQIEAGASTANRALSQQRAGVQQIGFQVGDFFTQISAGTSPFVAFSQQIGQAAGALQLMGGAAGGTTTFMGRLAGVLSGPFGIAIAAGLPLIGLFAARLFDASDAADAAKKASEELAKRQLDIKNFFDLSTGAILENNSALIENAILQREIARREIAVTARTRGRRAAELVSESVTDRPLIATNRRTSDGRFTQYVEGPGNRDLVEAFRLPADQRNRRLREIGTSSSTNAARARELSNLIAQNENDRALLTVRGEESRSLETGRLSDSLRTPSRQRRTRTNRGPSAETIANRAFARAEFGRDTADRVQAINDRWSEQPRLVQQASAATRQLDDILDDVQKRKPPNMAELVTSIQAARAAIQEGLLRPYREMLRAHEDQRQVQLLVLQGREREAEVLTRVQQLRDRGLDVTQEQRDVIEEMVLAEERMSDLLDKRETIIEAYRASIGDLRGSIEDLFSGGSFADFGRNLMQNARQLRARLTTEQLFGSSLRELERDMREATGLEGAVEELDRQTRSAATALERITAAATGTAAAVAGEGATKLARSGPAKALRGGSKQAEGEGTEILVMGSRLPRSGDGDTLTSMTPQDYFQRVGQVLAQPVIRLLQQLDDTIGTRLAGRLGGVIEGGIAGYMQAGPVGGLLGAINGSGRLRGNAATLFGKAQDGANTGALVNQIAGSLGLRGSQNGAALGGALGSALPIPGGQIIGSILGNFVGGLFKKSKTGSATITSVDGKAVIGGKNSQARQQSGEIASQVQNALKQIAETLGGDVGSFNVSVGVRNGNIHVDPTGRGLTKKKQGALDFGQDSAAAIMAALADAIGDGGITGLSAAVAQALRSSSDIDAALKEALKVQEVEELLGGLGAVLSRQFRSFEAQAKERVRIATQYGFDVTAIEARNAEDRKKLVDTILADRVGSLQQLLSDFRFGDLFEGTAADRRQALLAEEEKARKDAEAGVDGAAQRLADISRQLVSTSKDAFGTAGPEYAADRANAVTAAERVIALENERIRVAQETAAGTKAAIEQNNALTNETNDLLAQILAQGGFGGGFGGGGGFDVGGGFATFDTSRG